MSKKVNTGGRPKRPPSPKVYLKSIIPVSDMFSEDEVEIYDSLVDIYLSDFQDDELTSSDLDDIMSLATNKVLEIRLLQDAKKTKDPLSFPSIDKLRKQNEKIKENLSARRRDRINPNELKGFSIIDLAVAFDDNKKSALESKARKMKKEQNESQKKLTSYGNRDDKDGFQGDGEEK